MSKQINFASKLFQPLTLPPKQCKDLNLLKASKSQRLMLDLGIIRQSQNGIFHLLPLGLRVMNKLKCLVQRKMMEIGAQEISIPLIVDNGLWKKSGRWTDGVQDLFTFQDRHQRNYLLTPTSEESAADLLASIPQLSHKQLPIRLFQMSTKFRDEMKPRCGLVRSREFLMKDLYTFDLTIEEAENTYNQLTSQYRRLFKELNLDCFRVEADPGEIGGLMSHEYHLPCDLGEDNLYLCENCRIVGSSSTTRQSCEKCRNSNLLKITGLEVGHTFLLGDKYSKPLNATYRDDKNTVNPLMMGSYGLGLSRILAACVEILSLDVEIRWPKPLAPYTLTIVTPKCGSTESSLVGDYPLEVYHTLNEIPQLNNDIIIDDRAEFTIGKRLLHWKRTGLPYVLVIGSKATATPPMLELINVYENTSSYLTVEEIINVFNLNEIYRISLSV